jgi:hypothetical protein
LSHFSKYPDRQNASDSKTRTLSYNRHLIYNCVLDRFVLCEYQLDSLECLVFIIDQLIRLTLSLCVNLLKLYLNIYNLNTCKQALTHALSLSYNLALFLSLSHLPTKQTTHTSTHSVQARTLSLTHTHSSFSRSLYFLRTNNLLNFIGMVKIWISLTLIWGLGGKQLGEGGVYTSL